MELFKDFKKYKWFYTSSGKLVIGGKSASQNEEILRIIKKSGKEFFIMHTSDPGSPFSIIISEIEKVNKYDLDEAASFTGSFSRAWRSGKKKAVVDIFLASKLFKIPLMKEGTWGVKEVISKKEINLELALTMQEGILRAVPIETVKSKDILLKVTPGKVDKTKMLNELKTKLKNKFSSDQILSALPAGGLEIK